MSLNSVKTFRENPIVALTKGINTSSVKRQRQRQGPIGMHCDAPTQASKLQGYRCR